jgi:hypothetical protein
MSLKMRNSDPQTGSFAAQHQAYSTMTDNNFSHSKLLQTYSKITEDLPNDFEK